MFSEIPNKNLAPTVFPADPFLRDTPANIIYAVPIEDLRKMIIKWVIPDYMDSYQSNPPKYVTELSKQAISLYQYNTTIRLF